MLGEITIFVTRIKFSQNIGKRFEFSLKHSKTIFTKTIFTKKIDELYRIMPVVSEAALQRCSYEKVF